MMASGGAASNLCESRSLSAPEVRAWLAHASVGERLVYCTGPTLVRGGAADLARDLYQAGLVDLLQRRAQGCSGFEYLVEKKAARPARGEARAEADRDEATATILAMLKRFANFGRRCPTNPELAKAAGLATAAQAAWRLTKLSESGEIRVQTETAGPEAGWRVVTIVATGKRTKAPPSWEQLRRSINEGMQDER